MSTAVRIKDRSELSLKARLATPVATVFGGLGGYALEVLAGKSVAEGLITGVVVGAITGATGYFIPRLDESEDIQRPSS